MKLITLISFILCSLASANELKISSFYYINSNTNKDRSAEICFTLKPAPQNPVFANITIDEGTNSESFYNTFIGPRGKACAVVTTWRGIGEVTIPSMRSDFVSAQAQIK